MEIVNKYEPAEIDRLYRLLENTSRTGSPVYFDVMVDGIRILPRCNTLSQFYLFKDYITPNTRQIIIRVFSASSKTPRHIRHIFNIESSKENDSQTLSGLNMQSQFDELLRKARADWETEKKVETVDQLKADLAEAEKYIEKLEQEVLGFRSKKMMWGDVNLGDFASVIVEGIIRRNPHYLASIPGAEGLAGLIEKENSEKNIPASPSAPVEVSYTPVSQPALSPEKQKLLGLLEALQQHFSQSELDTIMEILNQFLVDHSLISAVADLLDKNPMPPQA